MFVPKHKLRNVVSFAGWISPLEKFPMFLDCWLSAVYWLLPLQLLLLLLLCVYFVCFAETRTQFARFAAYRFFSFALLLFLSLFLSRKCNFNLNKSKIKTKINCGQLHSGAGKLFRVRRMWICEYCVCGCSLWHTRTHTTQRRVQMVRRKWNDNKLCVSKIVCELVLHVCLLSISLAATCRVSATLVPPRTLHINRTLANLVDACKNGTQHSLYEKRQIWQNCEGRPKTKTASNERNDRPEAHTTVWKLAKKKMGIE